VKLVVAVGFATSVLAAAAAAAAAGAPASTTADGVPAQAARAIAHTFYTVAEIRPARPGLFAPTTSSGYLDPARGRGHWHVTSDGKLVSETVVEGARVKRYDAADDTLTVASSCRAFASGCAEVLDPVDVYRRALTSGADATEQAGADWRLTLRGVADVEQIVTVDGTTYLPKSIEWRENGAPVSTVRIATLERQAGFDREKFRLDAHPGARVRLLTANGEPVRVLSRRATAVPRGAYWLGPSYQGRAARGIDVRTTAGRALRVEYGPIAVWNYDDYLPPQIVAATTGFAKTFLLPQGGGVARTYFNVQGLVVADVEIGGRRVALVSPGKVDIFNAVRQLRKHP
jgi:hypothetical protein